MGFVSYYCRFVDFFKSHLKSRRTKWLLKKIGASFGRIKNSNLRILDIAIKYGYHSQEFYKIICTAL